MCIIASGFKKDLKREEVVQCMKSNASGNFCMAIRTTTDNKTKKTKRSIVDMTRTLEVQPVLDIFDKIEDDDLFILHARIPSRGDRTVKNVHGWEEEGVYFCHNGTLGNVKTTGTETDSETFFRKIFIPAYKAYGKKMTKDLEFLVDTIAGSGNKFLFVMPDLTVRTFGHFTEDHKCLFSNGSYKSYTPSYTGSTWGGYEGGYGYSGGYGQTRTTVKEVSKPATTNYTKKPIKRSDLEDLYTDAMKWRNLREFIDEQELDEDAGYLW